MADQNLGYLKTPNGQSCNDKQGLSNADELFCLIQDPFSTGPV